MTIFTSSKTGAQIEASLLLADTSVQNTGDTMTGTLTLDQNADAVSLDIDSEATTADVINISAPLTTTGNVLDITLAASLTTGRLARFNSNSSSTATRDLVIITNDNASATGATCLNIQQDAANQCAIFNQTAASSYIDYQGTAAANATDPISTLTTSGATTNHIQIEINGVKAWIAVSTTDPS